MNEPLFLLHISIAALFVLGALRLGRGALVSLVVLQAVLANLFVLKQISLFGFSVTCSDVYAIGSILALNVLQEYFGKEAAQKAIQISLIGLLFFALMSQIHLFYAPTLQDTSDGAFQTILSATPRIIFASIGVFYIVQKIDVLLFGWLNRSTVFPFAIRVGISLAVSQFLDTFLFSFAGLYGLVESVFDIILVSYVVKLTIIACSAPFVAWSKRIVKNVPV